MNNKKNTADIYRAETKKYIIKSKVTGIEYDLKKCVRVINPRQQAAYLKYGAKIIDVYASESYETGEAIICMLFDKEETYPLYDAWCNYALR